MEATVEYLTPEEFATIFRLTPEVVRNYARSGKVKAVWFSPRRIRIPKSEVERIRKDGISS